MGIHLSAPEPTMAPVSAWVRRLILIIPLLSLALLIEVGATRERAARLQAFSAQCRSTLESVAVEIDAELGVIEPLLRIGHLAGFGWPGQTDRLSRVAEHARQNSSKLGLNLYFFSPEGIWSGCYPEKAENQWMFRKIVLGLGCGTAVTGEQRKEIDRLLRSILGYGHSLNTLLLSQGRPMPVMYRNKPAWIFWEKGPAGSVFAVCQNWPSDRDRLQAAGKRYRGIWNPRTLMGYKPAGQDIWETHGWGTPEQTATLWQHLAGGTGDGVEWDGRWCFFRSSRGGGTLVMGFPVPDPLRSRKVAATTLWLLVLGVPLTVAAGFGRDRLGSVRRALILLFLVTALVPTGGLVTETLLSLEVRREVLEGEVARAQSGALRAIDQGFGEYLHRLEMRWAGQMLTRSFHQEGKALVPKEVEQLVAGFGGHYDLRAPSGTILAGSSGAGGLGAVGNSFLLMALETWIPERIPPIPPKIDPVLDGALREPRTGFWNIAQRPLRLLELSTGKRIQFLFWHYFSDPRNPAAMFLSVLPGENLIRQYLGEAVRERFGLWGTAMRCRAFHLRKDEQIPSGTVFRDPLKFACQRALVLGRPVSGSIRAGRREWRFLALPGREMKDYLLCALFPQADIDVRVRDLRNRLMTGALLSLLAAALVGILLAQTLLRPMEDLSAGISALAAKSFDCPVPVRQRDELGLLAQAFNQMTAELKDLNIAGAVQGALIPHSYPKVAGYDLDGRVKFAGDLGGDCLDCRPLADGRLFFLIGDVSGHGASSALIMAFTRATVTLWLKEGKADLQKLADQLQGLLSTLPGRRLFLALYCGVLDPYTHQVQALCAGHPFPVAVSSRGNVRFLGRPAYPLGSRRHGTGGVLTSFALEPDEALVLYTDGLVEARAAGREWGYQGLEDWLCRTAGTWQQGENPGCDLLQELVSTHERQFPQADDDVSLLVIFRRGGGME